MGRIEPRTVALRGGGSCLLRSAEPTDAGAIVVHRRAQIGSHDFEINLPHEVDLDPERQVGMIQEALDRENWVYIVAEVPTLEPSSLTPSPPHLVGGLLFRGQEKHRMRHHGTFGIATDAAWRGRGVGRAMIEALLDWAADHPFLEKVCLFCFETNRKAQALYRSMGFMREGLSVRHFQMSPGQYVDDVSMSIFVKAGAAPPGFNTWQRTAIANTK